MNKFFAVAVLAIVAASFTAVSAEAKCKPTNPGGLKSQLVRVTKVSSGPGGVVYSTPLSPVWYLHSPSGKGKIKKTKIVVYLKCK